MLIRNFVTALASAALLAALIVLSGCSINVKDKDKNGEGRVDIKTPMGDIHVNEQPDIRETGLSLYAGAKPAPKDNGEDKKSANVNISGMGFALKVVAAEFQSDDSPDKIISYYNKELQRYGKPIECRGRWTGGDVNAASRLSGERAWRLGRVEGRHRREPAYCRREAGWQRDAVCIGICPDARREGQHDLGGSSPRLFVLSCSPGEPALASEEWIIPANGVARRLKTGVPSVPNAAHPR